MRYAVCSDIDMILCCVDCCYCICVSVVFTVCLLYLLCLLYCLYCVYCIYWFFLSSYTPLCSPLLLFLLSSCSLLTAQQISVLFFI
ncbi:hypothetical protein BZA70DRAFT_270815 [Myxozyma melibiosi]|uniref:Uncharacterized protein n=1 Tax=Myxozyma melibiosi TaxID=54550 RepID=A0ABR1FBL6_9ASCO